jgi:hypothetical protein
MTYDRVVEGLIYGICGGKEKERVNKQRKVGFHTYV